MNKPKLFNPSSEEITAAAKRLVVESVKTKFIKGDKVVMHSCMEADFEKYKGKIWTCSTASQFSGDHESVFLEGFRGSFSAEYLQIVNIPDRDDEMKEILKTYIEEFKAFNFSAETFKRAEQILKELKE